MRCRPVTTDRTDTFALVLYMHGPLIELASGFVFYSFYHNILCSNTAFLIKFINYTVEFQESRSGDSASLRLGAAKIDSRVSKYLR